MLNLESVKISILTATCNRVDSLPRLYESLEQQTRPIAEWLVADDGSEDGTVDYITKISSTASFPITLLSSPRRLGKTVQENALVQHASGDYCIFCDSDDYLTDRAIDLFIDILGLHYSSYSHLPKIIATDVVKLADYKSRQDSQLSRLSDLVKYVDYYQLRKLIPGDGCLLISRELYKAVKFPEVDFVVHENAAWYPLFSKTIFIYAPITTKIMGYLPSDSVTHARNMMYTFGSAYALLYTAQLQASDPRYSMSFFGQVSRLVTFLRWSFHSHLLPLKLWNNIWLRLFDLVPIPIKIVLFLPAFLLYIYDLLTKRCVNTQVLFIEASTTPRPSIR